MKTLTRFAIGVAAATSVVLAQAGVAAPEVRETRPLSGPFTAVRLVGSIDLEVTQEDTPGLIIEARPDQMTDIRTEVRHGELIIDYDSPIEIHLGRHSSRGPRALLSVKMLERIKVQGSGDVTMNSWTTPGDLELALSGSGDATIDKLYARNLIVGISGSDDVEIGGGSVESAEVHISGSGDFKAERLKAASATISVAGSGDVEVWAVKSLAVSIAGSGDVSYFGHPTLTQRIAGSGELTARGDQ